jgi:hypothetical protein
LWLIVMRPASRNVLAMMAQVPNDVLHHDDGAIHNHSEVERAK